MYFSIPPNYHSSLLCVHFSPRALYSFPYKFSSDTIYLLFEELPLVYITFPVGLLTMVLFVCFSSRYLRVSLFCLIFEVYFSKTFSFSTFKNMITMPHDFYHFYREVNCQSYCYSFESNVFFLYNWFYNFPFVFEFHCLGMVFFLFILLGFCIAS